MSTEVIQVRRKKDVPSAAEQGAKAIRAGKLVGFATETVYGIAAIATQPRTIERLRTLKSRPEAPFSVHIGRAEDVKRYVGELSDTARRLIERAWPGPVTVLAPTSGELADKSLQQKGLHDVLCMNNTIGLRFPDEPTAIEMLSQVRSPVVAPSANLAGEASPRSAEDVLASLDGKIDLLIDSGKTKLGTDSTIIRFDQAGAWELLRKGPYSSRDIKNMIRRRYLFVCTGNTCRSPMAEGIAKKRIADHLGVAVKDLKKNGYEVQSAGLFAGEHSHATPEAVDAAREFGADISRHRSRKLTPELINSADVIFCMTEFHVDEIRHWIPDAADRVETLSTSGEISDPIGGGPDVYKKTVRQIEKAVKRRLRKDLS